MTKPPRPSVRTSDKAATGTGSTASKGAKKAPANKAPGSPQARKVQSRKIVNRRQTPWGLIVVTAVVALLAIGVIGYAVSQNSGKKSNSAQGGTSAASDIKIAGIQHYANLSRTHQTTTVTYQQSPPVGGNHSPVWADCTGTVYPNQIANENAVHTLEHGAVWITYKPGLAASQVDILSKLVAGQQYMLLTPYAGLKSNVSLQAWGYQLFVDSASDPRVKQFISDLKLNQSNTPELGASCDNPSFKSNPSTPGHPTES
ncbi:MAG: hypothetical protein QOK10_931 [Pseudonocardiales bacterium]|jgi:hypothetical protein|nr:hypothetical protein [Pseudonocardiales bacterium]